MLTQHDYEKQETITQRSPEWFESRLGRITASGFDMLMKKTKYGESEYKKKYRMQLALERLTGVQANPIPVNKAMQDGIDREPEARDEFVKATDIQAQECGVYQHKKVKNSAASPDGIIESDKGRLCLEIKCPTMMTHGTNLLHDEVPKKYLYQIMWQIACSDSVGAYWVSYNPEFTDETKLKYLYIERDDKLITEMENAAIEFDFEVDELVKTLKKGATHG